MDGGRRFAPGLDLAVKAVPLGVFAALFLLLAAEPAWFARVTYYLFGFYRGYEPFFDAYIPLSWIECARHGVDAYLANPCDTRFGSHLTMDYPPSWLLLGWFGLGTADLPWVVAAWGGGFLLSLLLLPRLRSRGAALALLASAVSCTSAFALFQANFDLVVFAVLTAGAALVARGGRARHAAYAAALLLGCMKLYPVFGLVLALRERLGRAALVLGAAGLAMAGFMLLIRDDLGFIRRGLPTRDPIGLFGAGNLAVGLPVLLPGHAPGAGGLALIYAVLLALGLAIAVLLGRAVAREGLPARLTGHERLCLLLGAAMMVLCFLLTQNGRYRAIFLILTVLPLAELRRLAGGRGLRLVLRLALLGVVVLAWGVYLMCGVDHVQKAVLQVEVPPANALRAVAWLAREAAWWFVMSVLAGLGGAVAAGLPALAEARQRFLS